MLFDANVGHRARPSARSGRHARGGRLARRGRLQRVAGVLHVATEQRARGTAGDFFRLQFPGGVIECRPGVTGVSFGGQLLGSALGAGFAALVLTGAGFLAVEPRPAAAAIRFDRRFGFTAEPRCIAPDESSDSPPWGEGAVLLWQT